VYARGLATEGGFHYNPSEAEAGMSSPLWVVLLGILLRVGLSPVAAAKAASIGLAFGVVAAVYHRSLDLLSSPAGGWVAGSLTMLHPFFAYSRVAGMEVMLFALLILLALGYAHQRRPMALGITMSLALVTRAEFLPLALLLGGLALGAEYIRRRELVLVTAEEARLWAMLFLPCLVAGGAWVAFNLATGGHPLPNTYYVKHDFALGLVAPGNLLHILQGYLFQSFLFSGPLIVPTLAALIYGSYVLVRRQRVAAVGWVAAPWLFIYFLSINVRLVADRWNFSARRYLDFLWPLLAVLIAACVTDLWQRARSAQHRALVLGAPVAVFAVAAVYALPMARQTLAMAEEFSWNSRNVQEVNVAMGRWIEANLPPSAVIAVTDAGAMRYFGGRYTVDLIGLNESSTIGRPLEDLLPEIRPDYTFLFRSDLTDGLRYLEEVYHLQTERNTILGGSDLVAYRFLP
jgi:hypothetical protein